VPYVEVWEVTQERGNREKISEGGKGEEEEKW